ncbi:MFS transporter [Boudabousia liubingyangii]|uniref:MFS transporter n=1 Tax=Boudabousia liubingyangii TaxID=1921764 RepID=UPI00093DA19A|nr:MFS transporter [Boudabousia liubingyangii]
MSTTVDPQTQDLEFAHQLRRAKIAAATGTALDQMEMTLFSLAAALVFGHVFFGDTSPAVALIASFGVYGVGFLIRPIGGLIFSHLGETKGRKWVLSTTVMMMGAATFGIGLIPSWQSIGIFAPLLLILARCVQGAAVGAEYTSGTTYLTEIAPIGRRGRTASWVWAGASAGTVLGALVWFVVMSVFTKQQVLDWAWRIPFWMTIFVTFFAMWLRRRLQESPVFVEKQKAFKQRAENAAPLALAFKNSKLNMLRVFGLTFPCVGHSFLYQAFMAGYFVNYVVKDGDGGKIFSSATSVGAVVGIGGALLGGYLSDKLGRRTAGLIYTTIMMIFPPIAFLLINTGQFAAVVAVMIFCFCFPAEGAMGVQSPQLPEIFGARNRYSAQTVAREIGAIGGGLLPMIATAIMATFEMWVPVAIMMVILMAAAVLTTYLTPETKDRDLYELDDAM